MRVLRPLQQHAVKMLSEAEEDDTNLANSVQPLPPFTNTSGKVLIHQQESIKLIVKHQAACENNRFERHLTGQHIFR